MITFWHWATADGWHLLCLTCAVGIPLALIPITVSVDRWVERRWP